MSETEKSFAYLQENIPQWLKDVDNLEKKVVSLKEQAKNGSASNLSAAKKTVEPTEPYQASRSRPIPRQAAPSQGAQTDPLGIQKIRTLSVSSGRVSGPSRLVSKQMVPVNYDGDVQNAFELLVRAIGTGRNMLRKAKMQSRMSELTALAGSNDDDDDDDDEGDDEDNSNIEVAVTSENIHRPHVPSMQAIAAVRRSGRSRLGQDPNAPVESIDTADRYLESAQSLCERVAHLALRDGDCTKQMDQVRNDFKYVLDIAEIKAVKCTEGELLGPQVIPSQETLNTSSSSVEPSLNLNVPTVAISALEREPKPHVIMLNMPIRPMPAGPEALDLEVDDEDDEEDTNFVLPPVRLTSRLTARAC